jgi:hypothetical protein
MAQKFTKPDLSWMSGRTGRPHPVFIDSIVTHLATLPEDPSRPLAPNLQFPLLLSSWLSILEAKAGRALDMEWSTVAFSVLRSVPRDVPVPIDVYALGPCMA